MRQINIKKYNDTNRYNIKYIGDKIMHSENTEGTSIARLSQQLMKRSATHSIH